MGFVHCLVFQKAQSNATFWELCMFPSSGKRRWGSFLLNLAHQKELQTVPDLHSFRLHDFSKIKMNWVITVWIVYRFFTCWNASAVRWRWLKNTAAWYLSQVGRWGGGGVILFLGIWCVCSWVWRGVIIPWLIRFSGVLDFNWDFPCVYNWSYVYPVLTCTGPSVV